MKKYLLLLATLFVAGFMASCDSDPSDSGIDAGGTAVKKMCGAWKVSVYTCKAPGDEKDIDSWKWELLGPFSSDLQTYNTSANTKDSMWVDDQGETNLGDGNDYSHKVKVAVNYKKRTFSIAGAESQYTHDAITIIGGKVLQNAAVNDRGVKEDSIVYYVKAAHSTMGYLKVSGYRQNY